MTDKANLKFQKELNAGAISLVLLSILTKQGKPMYGYEIARNLEASSKDELPMNQAAIYPALRSMEKKELLKSEMVPSDSGPPRRYYHVTPTGKRALTQWKSIWTSTVSFVDFILDGENENANHKTATRSGDSVSSRTGT